jgi:hypothetical protein
MVRHSKQVFSILLVLGSSLVPAVARAQTASPVIEPPAVAKRPSLIVSESSRSTAGLAPLAGLRVAPRTSDVVQEPTRVPDPNRALGKDVRVTLNDGTTQRGKLEALSASEVTVKGTAIPLADVRKIEKVGHATRKAAVIGLLAGVPTLLILGPAADMGADMALMIVAAGVGGGIAVGAVIDAAHKPGNVIYVAPGTSVSFTVRPILTRDRKGVAFATSW